MTYVFGLSVPPFDHGFFSESMVGDLTWDAVALDRVKTRLRGFKLYTYKIQEAATYTVSSPEHCLLVSHHCLYLLYLVQKGVSLDPVPIDSPPGQLPLGISFLQRTRWMTTRLNTLNVEKKNMRCSCFSFLDSLTMPDPAQTGFLAAVYSWTNRFQAKNCMYHRLRGNQKKRPANSVGQCFTEI